MKNPILNIQKATILLLVCLTIIITSATSDDDQTYQPTSSKFQKGLKFEEENNYKEAILIFKKLTKNNTQFTAELLYHIGFCQLNLTNADTAVISLTHAHQYVDSAKLTSDLSVDILLTLGKSLQIALSPNRAITIYQELLGIISDTDAELKKEIEYQIQSCKNAQIYMDNPVNISIKNLGPNINSPANDHSPVVSLDENQIYYTSRQSSKKENSLEDGSNPEKIYHSVLSSNEWSKNFLLEVFFRNFENESALSLSADGTELFLFRNDLEGQSLYESIYDGTKWTKPFKLPAPINGPYNETHACLSPDKSTLFFTSDRPGGLGGKDIYLVRKNKDGVWGSLTNLGPNINSELDEETPIFHYDGKTLYFASEGHNSMGRMDVFYSQMNADSTWNEPINLGYPINSPDDDFFFAPSISKDHAFYASSRQGENYGGSDIYRVEFKKFIQGNLAVIEESINPNDPENIKKGKIRIMVSQKETNKPVGNYSPGLDGKCMLFLETGKSYNVIQKEEGFEDIKTEIKVTDSLTYKPGKKFVSFASLKVEPPLIMGNNKTAQFVTKSGKNAQDQTSTRSDEILNSSEIKIYTIQLLALKRRTRPFKNYFQNLKAYKIKQHRCIDGFTRFTIGSYNSIAEAQEVLSKIQLKGHFTDAFIRNSEHHGEKFQH